MLSLCRLVDWSSIDLHISVDPKHNFRSFAANFWQCVVSFYHEKLCVVLQVLPSLNADHQHAFARFLSSRVRRQSKGMNERNMNSFDRINYSTRWRVPLIVGAETQYLMSVIACWDQALVSRFASFCPGTTTPLAFKCNIVGISVFQERFYQEHLSSWRSTEQTWIENYGTHICLISHF